MTKYLFRWLVRELEKINYKLDIIIQELKDERMIARDTEILHKSSDKLKKAVEENQPR